MESASGPTRPAGSRTYSFSSAKEEVPFNKIRLPFDLHLNHDVKLATKSM